MPNDKFVDVNDSQIETIRPPASPRRFQQFGDCRLPVPNDPVCDSRVEANRELKRFGPAPPTRIPGPVIWVIYRENMVWPDPVVWVISRENVVWPVFLALEYIIESYIIWAVPELVKLRWYYVKYTYEGKQ